MPRKVCFLISSVSKSGGTERVCTNLANSLSNQGYSVRVASLFDGENFFALNSNIQLFYLGCKSNNLLSIIFCLRDFFNKKVDQEYVICISMGKLSFLSALIKKISLGNAKSCLLISSEHVGYHSYGSIKKALKFLGYMASDKVVFLTEKDRNIFSKTNKGKYSCIPNFISKEKKITMENKRDSGKKIALAIGRLCYQKNFQRLINLWQKAMEENSDIENGWDLYIVGDGDEREKLDRLLKEKETNIKILSPVKNIASLYEKSSLFLMTSRYEGLPMVLIESQSHGLPVIAFDCPTGPAEVIIDEKSGYLINYNDDSSYVDRLTKTLLNDNLREEMSEFSIKNAKRFSETEVIDKWKKLLR